MPHGRMDALKRETGVNPVRTRHCKDGVIAARSHWEYREGVVSR